MSEQKFTAGDKVVLKNNHEKVYIFLEYVDNNKTASCLTADNKTEQILAIALEKHKPSAPYAGGRF
jgi:hypothetical protein